MHGDAGVCQIFINTMTERRPWPRINKNAEYASTHSEGTPSESLEMHFGCSQK